MSKASGVSQAIVLEKLSCHFGQLRAVDDVSLGVEKGEFFAMLGPSGSGKSTCLRLVAGFQKPTSGRVRLFGEDVTQVPPYRRSVNNVFQDYALFPHMSVLENVAYGLLVKGVPKPVRERAAEEALELVRLEGFGARKPRQLSGGQQQRVALARALINKPEVLLLDEPLGALDLKLREQMQEELKELHHSLGITFILVTHDQGEALSMANRVAVFNEGRIAQVGTPQEVYKFPRSPFVANFVGSSNVLPPAFVDNLIGVRRWASLRPEALKLSKSDGVPARLIGTVVSDIYLGASHRIGVEVQGQRLQIAVAANQVTPMRGEAVELFWEDRDLHVMDAEHCV